MSNVPPLTLASASGKVATSRRASMNLSRALKRVALLLVPLLCAADSAFSQDTNYWTLQYGTRGELLGGVVVGSAVDLSATFYNPGSLALVLDPSTILTATVFGMETIKVTDVNPGQDAVTSRRTGPEPSLFAGSLPVTWFDGRWAYSRSEGRRVGKEW